MMFTSVQARAASAYRRTSVDSANPYQVVGLLFDGLMQSLSLASSAIHTGDVARKGEEISKSVRLLEEGLKLGLDLERGGELAANLKLIYDYSIQRLTYANLRNDRAALEEVMRLIAPVADGWRRMPPPASTPQAAAADGAAVYALEA